MGWASFYKCSKALLASSKPRKVAPLAKGDLQITIVQYEFINLKGGNCVPY